MSFDKRFYGIYSAIIADAEDPDELGRVKLIIPQVLGDNITEWALPVNGAVPQINFPYATYITTTNQTVSAANTATLVTNWQAEDTNKSYVSGTRMYVEESGDYLLIWSAILARSSASTAKVDLWIRINGVDLTNSNTRTHISGSSAEAIVTASFILDLEAGDYFEVVFSSDVSDARLQAFSGLTSPTRPAIPGIIATLNLVGKWKPQPGTKAWAMFEGGDPNFPVWMGALA